MQALETKKYQGKKSSFFAQLILATGLVFTPLAVKADTIKLPVTTKELKLTGTGNLDAKGNNLDNVITGNDGDNILTGGKGNDTLVGGKGNDTLIGGPGRDKLTGGPGADRFVFAKAKHSRVKKTKRDIITDYNPKQKDLIDLSKIDANTKKRGKQSFNFIGKKRFSGKGAEIRFAKRTLFADINGDRKPDLAITVKGKAKGKGIKKGLVKEEEKKKSKKAKGKKEKKGKKAKRSSSNKRSPSQERPRAEAFRHRS